MLFSSTQVLPAQEPHAVFCFHLVHNLLGIIIRTCTDVLSFQALPPCTYNHLQGQTLVVMCMKTASRRACLAEAQYATQCISQGFHEMSGHGLRHGPLAPGLSLALYRWTLLTWSIANTVHMHWPTGAPALKAHASVQSTSLMIRLNVVQ